MTTRRWRRPHTLLTAALGVLAFAAPFFVPEVRQWLGLEDAVVDAPLTTVVNADAGSPQGRPVGVAQQAALLPTDASRDVPAPTVTAQPSPSRSVDAMEQRDEITVGDGESLLPDVIAAADDALSMLRSRAHTVRGHLRSTQSPPDERLQGLITTDLTLDVKLVDTQGVVRHTFTITSRGGGFTGDSSALQARERLREALHEHLLKE